MIAAIQHFALDVSSNKRDRYIYASHAGDAPDPYYIGLGKHGANGKRRHLRHVQEAKNGREKSNPAKQQFIRDCLAAGIKIRHVFLHEGLTINEACEAERGLIAHYGRREFGGILFNLSAGGSGSHDPTPSTLARMSAARRGKKKPPRSPEYRANIAAARLGKKQSPEAIAKMSAAGRGKRRSPESIAKSAAGHRGRKRSLEAIEKTAAARRGKRHSPESIAKMSAAHRGTWNSRNTSGVKGVCLNRRDHKWRASIRINGKTKHLGYFDTCEAAAAAYATAEKLRVDGMTVTAYPNGGKARVKGVRQRKDNKKWIACIRLNGKTKYLGQFPTCDEAAAVYAAAVKLHLDGMTVTAYLSTRNTSGAIGVHWRKDNKKWRARIKINGKGKHLGLFNTIEAAAAAYAAAAAKQHDQTADGL